MPQEKSFNRWTSPYLNVKPGREISFRGKDFQALLTDVLSRGKNIRFQVSGQSMWPVLKSGDIVTLVPAEAESFRRGDIGAFVTGKWKHVVVHRVIAIDERQLLVKGDNNLGADGYFTGEQVLGKVVEVTRKGKSVRLGTSHLSRPVAILSRRGRVVTLPGFVFRLYRLVRRVVQKKSIGK